MINFNGTLLEENTVLSTENRGYAYGDALFETIKTSGGKILFWEDHYFRLMASMRIMRMEIPMNFTMEFLEADCAEAALLELERQKVDIVVSDVNMPGMDGHELLNQIKRKYPSLPMMLITAFGQVKLAVEAMQNGASDYLVKPFEPKVLIQSIIKILGMSDESAGGDQIGQSNAPVAEDPFTKQFFQTLW